MAVPTGPVCRGGSELAAPNGRRPTAGGGDPQAKNGARSATGYSAPESREEATRRGAERRGLRRDRQDCSTRWRERPTRLHPACRDLLVVGPRRCPHHTGLRPSSAERRSTPRPEAVDESLPATQATQRPGASGAAAPAGRGLSNSLYCRSFQSQEWP